jgi:hypothetical protein
LDVWEASRVRGIVEGNTRKCSVSFDAIGVRKVLGIEERKEDIRWWER